MNNDTTPRTFGELYTAITAIIPNASFDETVDGQIIIYTDLVVNYDAEEELLEPFCELDSF